MEGGNRVIRLRAALCLGAAFFIVLDPLHGQEPAQPSPTPWPILRPWENADPLPGTALLEPLADPAADMVAGIDLFLLDRIEAARSRRSKDWQLISDPNDPSTRAKREALARLLGIDPEQLTRYQAVSDCVLGVLPLETRAAADVAIRRIRWSVRPGLSGEGLLLQASSTPPLGLVVAIPDADQSPESQVLPERSNTKPGASYPLRLARAGYQVLVPRLVPRRDHPQHRMSVREWLHRPAFTLGRTLIGYELEKILAGAAALQHNSASEAGTLPLGVLGWGEGGRLALLAGALDTRFDAVGVAGYFGPREALWREPADRNVFGRLNHFGDAEIASLVAPRHLVIEAGPSPDFGYRLGANGRPQSLDTREAYQQRGKPGLLLQHEAETVRAEFSRARGYLEGHGQASSLELTESDTPLGDATLNAFHDALLGATAPPFPAPSPRSVPTAEVALDSIAAAIASREAAQQAEIERLNQLALVDAYPRRLSYFEDLETHSLEAFETSVEAYRTRFRQDVIGDFGLDLLAPNPRSRAYQEGEKTRSYEVVLDVHPGVFAYGVLTVPKDLPLDGSQRRPVVVCQHGLEGRPQDVIGESKFKAYQAYATRLAERGFITFSPQNPYRYFDRFRTLQFKSQSIGCTLFTVIIDQHQAIVDWLQTQPWVMPDRIGFYGLSYGGKSAMRIPAVVTDYALSICSGDFNEWVWKNAATDARSLRYSYANKAEYEMFEWDLGGTFNYAEMAYLICPRPFMVERGHFDGVAPDDRVAQEFAKVRFLYQGRLGIGDRTEIEWFPGPHAINGVGSYAFLHRHLDWPEPTREPE